MSQQHIRMGLLGASIALGVVTLLLVLHPRVGPLERAFLVFQGRATRPAAAANAVPARQPPVAPGEPSRLADGLNSPEGNIRADLRIVDAILAAYRGALGSGNPAGENSEITAALTGQNRLSCAFIRPDCPAIDSKGQLCDRWGTPFLFHELSAGRMEIRSAGPDRQLWTADDEVLAP